MSDWGGGLLAHIHSVGEDGRACVVEVWQDEQSVERFQERLMPVLERMGITQGMRAQVYETNTSSRDRTPAPADPLGTRPRHRRRPAT